jgi:hypothetical protein
MFLCDACGQKLDGGIGLKGSGLEFRFVYCLDCDLFWTVEAENRLIPMDPYKPLAIEHKLELPPYFVPPKCNFSDN